MWNSACFMGFFEKAEMWQVDPHFSRQGFIYHVSKLHSYLQCMFNLIIGNDFMFKIKFWGMGGWGLSFYSIYGTLSILADNFHPHIQIDLAHFCHSRTHWREHQGTRGGLSCPRTHWYVGWTSQWLNRWPFNSTTWAAAVRHWYI